MFTIETVFILVFLGVSSVWSATSTFSVKSDDRILFLGGMNVVTGGALPYGFVNVLKHEMQILYPNITVQSAGFADDDGTELLSNLNMLLLENMYKPTKVILSLGLEMSTGHTDIASLDRLKFELESLVARLQQDKIEVILCPVAFGGERVDVEHDIDEFIQAYTLINKQIAKEYDVMHVNLAPQVNSFLDSNNIDKLEHSVLTLDGSILNERGHLFVALALLRGFGISQHSLSEDNAIVREQLRVHAIKLEIDRINNIDIEVATF